MLPANRHEVLLFFLWISPHAFLGVLGVILYRHRWYRELPCFFALVLYEIAEFILLFALGSAYRVHIATLDEYRYAYYATLLVSVALRFGVIDEVSRSLLRESQFLQVAARRLLQCVTGLLLGLSVLLAVYAPGNNNIRWIAGVSVVDRGAAMVQCGLLLSLLLFSRFWGVSWRRPAFGITLGLGILTSVDLAIRTVRTELSSGVWVPYLDLMTTGTYLTCVLIWIGYLLAPEPEPVPFAVLPHDEVEIWNTEFQHLLKD